MTVNRWSLEYWLCAEVHNWVAGVQESLDPVQLSHHRHAMDAIARWEHVLEDPRPLDLVRDAHQKAFEDVSSLQTFDQVRMYAALVHSELLCAFPLRLSHWPNLRIAEGRIPNRPATELFHVGPETDPERPDYVGRYSIVVPVHTLKNGERNHELRKLDPPRIVFQLPARLDSVLTTYLKEVRPRLVRPEDAGNNNLFMRTADSLRHSLKELQTKWLIRELGLQEAWAVHPYRALVATHVVKNAEENPYRIAAMLLLDSEATVRKTYSRFRPEDDQARAHAALAFHEGLGLA